MHIIYIFLFSLLLVTTGCEDKKSNSSMPIENTTEILNTQTQNSTNGNRFKLHSNAVTQTSMASKKPISLKDTFSLHNLKKKTYTVNVDNKKLMLTPTNKSIVLLNFFSTWCPPCLYEIPYFNDLQKKYNQDLLLVSVLVHDKITLPKFKSFLAKNDVQYFVSRSIENNDFASLVAKILHLPKNFSIPLTVMYANGKYFTHYEGIVPVEMIEYDIEQALKSLKNKGK